MEQDSRPRHLEQAEVEQIVSQYAGLFVQRWDTFARQRDHSRLYYRVTDQNGRPVPLTRHDIIRHLRGEMTLGLYSLDRTGHTKWSVVDGDNGLSPIVAVRDQLALRGVPSYLEASNRGGHLWVFWRQPVSPTAAKRFLSPITGDLELFPSGDIPDEDGVGLLIRAPLGIHRATMHRYGFLDDHLAPIVPGSKVRGQLAWLAEHVTRSVLPTAVLTQAVDEYGAHPVPRGGAIPALEEGPISQWVDDHDTRSVIGQYVELNRAGVGHCPWGAKHKHMDRHKSFQVYDSTQKWWCYAERIGGDAMNFLCRYFNVSPAEMLYRLRNKQ